jgi:DNA-binding LacI/PurR family transcriptional regulator
MSRMQTGRKGRKPTLEQVARYAGVSRATVSRVVNGSTTVDPAIRATVEQAVEDLDYVPNPAARALMTKRTDTVTLVAAETDTRVFGDPFFAQIVRGVSHELTGSSVRLTLSMTQTDAEIAALARYLSAGHTDGVLLISEHGRHRLAEQLTDAGIPVVIGGRPLDPRVLVPYVDNDNVGAARRAAQYLKAQGRTRVATIAGPQDMSAGVDRLEGFAKGLGRDFRKGRVEHGDFTTSSGEAAATRLLERHPDIDGIFVASDLMALGAMSTLRKAGRRVPDDVAVVGYDDIELARLGEPSLTTMRQETETQGRLMARLLLQSLDLPPTGPIPEPNAPDGRGIVQDVELVVRESA